MSRAFRDVDDDENTSEDEEDDEFRSIDELSELSIGPVSAAVGSDEISDVEASALVRAVSLGNGYITYEELERDRGHALERLAMTQSRVAQLQERLHTAEEWANQAHVQLESTQAQFHMREQLSQQQIEDLESQLQIEQCESDRLRAELANFRNQTNAIDSPPQIDEIDNSDREGIAPPTLPAAADGLISSLNRPSWLIDTRELLVTDRVIGRGAYGEVRLGIWKGCEVAVKQIHDIILSDYNRRIFGREIRMLSLLSHPHLVQCFGACVDSTHRMTLVLERMDFSLRYLLTTRQSINTREKLRIAVDIASALVYLHSVNPPVVHRDVSSAK
jgi:hypothetical protein